MPKQCLIDGIKPEQASALDEVWFWERPALKRKFQIMNMMEYGDLYDDNTTRRAKSRKLADEARNFKPAL